MDKKGKMCCFYPGHGNKVVVVYSTEELGDESSILYTYTRIMCSYINTYNQKMITEHRTQS